MRIASIAIRTLTFSTVVVSLTEGTLAANARFRANVIALLRDWIALLVRLAVGVMEADGQRRSTSKWPVGIANKWHWTGALEPAL